MRAFGLSVATVAIVGCVWPAFADVLPRATTADGSVVERKSGEEVRFVEVENWRGVDINQDLIAGDTLRTNAAGSLAIRFSDSTLVRMARETVLRVRKIDGMSSSELNLEGGTIWGRAERGGSGLTVDTPAAAAAIRGTDWALRADGDRTTLTVLEGTVELTNAQGSVTVNQGEGAVATLGQAPRKYILVDLEEREQMLLYGEIRGVFTGLSISGEETPDTRGERLRLLEKPEASRSPEDWLKLAETTLGYGGRAEAQAALGRLPRPLPAALEARAKLVEAMIAGQSMQYEEALALFAEALPRLSGERRTMAKYGEWIAASLKDPDTKVTLPTLNRTPLTASEAAAQATIIAHIRDQYAAIDALRKAEKRFPDDAGLAAMRAGLALELDRRDEVREALERARSIDPDDPAYLLMNARFRATVSSDLDGALADLKRATEVAPGDDAIWNELGIVQTDRNAPIEAAAAHRRAVDLNPENVAVRANYARFLMDHEQMAAAKREIDAAEALDPTSYAVLAAKGRYLLRMGKTAEGEKVLQEAAAVNPTYGDALIGLAIANYQSGASEEAAQALDNADRYDRDNPSISLIRAGMAIDQFRAGDAIRDAREGLRRREARGGYYAGYDVHRQASSVLGDALENLGMAEWGKYHKARAFDPFLAASYDDEQSAGQFSPFVATPPSGLDRYSSGSLFLPTNIQNFLLDPMGVAFEERFNALESRRFFEASLTTGLSSQAGETGWNGDVSIHGTDYSFVPVSYNFLGSLARPESVRENDTNDFDGGAFEIGMRPTLADNIYLFGQINGSQSGFPGQTFFPTPNDTISSEGGSLGGGWSHTISEKNVIQAFAMYERSDTHQHFESVDSVGPFSFDQTSKGESFSGGVSHLVGLGPVTLRYGAEAFDSTSDNEVRYTDLLTGDVFDAFTYPSDYQATRLYADAMIEVTNDLKVQAGAYYSWFDSESGIFDAVDPRIGIAWTPVENHWLRASYRRDTQYPVTQTLSPVSTVGLVPLDIPMFIQGEKETAAVRWDAEWSERLYTSVEYQHVTFDGTSLGIPDLSGFFDTRSGTIDRINISANYWLLDNLGLFGSFTWNDSKDTTPFTSAGDAVPLVPDYLAQIGFTYVHPSRVTFSLAQTFVGERVGAQFFDARGPFVVNLDRYSTTDAALTWKSHSGHLELGFTVLNAFDNDIDMAFDVPAPGRTFLATMKARF